MDPVLLTVILVFVVGVPVFFFFVIVAACLYETQYVQPYVVPQPGEEYDLSETARAANARARNLGFEHSGLCHDAKGKLYRVRYDFWLSPDRLTFVVIGGGSIAKIPMDGTWLYSRTRDERILETTNEIGSQDISCVVEQKTWPKMKFAPLVEKHGGRLEDLTSDQPIPFEEGAGLADYFAIRRARAEALVERGYARFLDNRESKWKYTLKGALTFYFISNWVRPFQRGSRGGKS